MSPIKFPPLNLPPVDIKIKKDGDLLKIYDPLRDKYVALTPEEYVRRHFSQWLITHCHYPASNIANEVGLEVNGTKKRCDTLIVDRFGDPLLVVEYKAPTVKVTQAVFDQIVRYNMVFKARYLVVSNGIQHYCCVVDYTNHSYQFIPRVPDYNETRFTEN